MPKNQEVFQTLYEISQTLNSILDPEKVLLKMMDIVIEHTGAERGFIITKDNLNAKVELVVYHKVKDDEESVKRSYYEVEDYKRQIIMLAQTTARNVIGNMRFTEVNSQRSMLNKLLAETIDKEIENWGL
jgi:regulator of protease activity HflC (stomatin/prohibitin superfamily)